MDLKKTKIGKLKNVFTGKLYRVRQAPVVLPNGEKGVFEAVYRSPSVTVIPIDDKGRLLMNQEYRPNYKKRVWRFPGGTIERGESPKQAAQRELQEETGFRAKNFSLFYKSSISQTIEWERFVFLAEGLAPSKLQNDDTEDIQISFITIAEAVSLIHQKEINHDLTEQMIYKLFLTPRQ